MNEQAQLLLPVEPKTKAPRRPRATIGQAATKLVMAAKGSRYADAMRCAEVLAFALERDGDPDSAAAVRAAITAEPSRQLVTSLPTAPGDWRKPGEPLDALVLSDDRLATFERLMVELEAAPRFVSAGIDAPTRVFFEGPSGVGKTLAAKHVAERLGLPLVTGRLDKVVKSHLGESSEQLAKLFEAARGAPCVIFIDEIDGISAPRAIGADGASAESNRITSSLLQQLDALPPEQVVIAASNFPDAIDPALYRRFPLRLPFDAPSFEARRKMLAHWWSKLDMGESRINKLAARTNNASGAELRALAMQEAREFILRGQ